MFKRLLLGLLKDVEAFPKCSWDKMSKNDNEWIERASKSESASDGSLRIALEGGLSVSVRFYLNCNFFSLQEMDE